MTEPKPTLRKDRAKLLFFLQKKEDLSYEEFSRYWIEDHAPIFLGLDIVKKNILFYEQLHVNQEVKKQMQSVGAPVADYDGVVVFEGESLQKLQEVVQHPEYVEKVVGDGKKLFNLETIRHGAYEVATIFDDFTSPEQRKHKIFVHPNKKDDISYEEFSRYWREVHGPQFIDLRRSSGVGSGVQRYDQLHFHPELGAKTDKVAPGDGITVLEAEKLEGLMAALADERFTKFAAEDGPNFTAMDKAPLVAPLKAVTFINK
ncbi:hypothetical protein V5O48_012727 [Marasmius crinis-equi]|uniref:EthD domain-containing protein n=1 Tax=Marasmius crinis-equi TaxID=585013 RepID=A0ABR3F229_9AGAR